MASVYIVNYFNSIGGTHSNIASATLLPKISDSVLETWHHKCASQKKQNDTLNTVAMTTVLPLVVC